MIRVFIALLLLLSQVASAGSYWTLPDEMRGNSEFKNTITFPTAGLKFGANLTVAGSTAAARTYTIPDIAATGTFALLEGAQTFTGIKSFSGGVTVLGDGINLLFDGGTYDYDVDIVTDTVRFGRSATTGTVVQFYQPGTSSNLLKLQASGIDIGVSTIGGTLTWSDGQTFSGGLVGLTFNSRTARWNNTNNSSIYGTSVGGSGIFNQGGHLVLETRGGTARDVIIYGGNSDTVIAQIGDLSNVLFNKAVTFTGGFAAQTISGAVTWSGAQTFSSAATFNNDVTVNVTAENALKLNRTDAGAAIQWQFNGSPGGVIEANGDDGLDFYTYANGASITKVMSLANTAITLSQPVTATRVNTTSGDTASLGSGAAADIATTVATGVYLVHVMGNSNSTQYAQGYAYANNSNGVTVTTLASATLTLGTSGTGKITVTNGATTQTVKYSVLRIL
jgi:hypothetical protein